MKKGYRLRHLGAATAVVALLAGGGVAYAATSSSGSGDTGSGGAATTQTQNDQGPAGFAAALAAKLGVETSKVEAALDVARQSATSRDTFVSALASELGVDAGKVEAALQDIGPPAGQGPGQGPGMGPGQGPGLDAAANYIGITETALQEALQGGKTLAQVATANGKSVDGLVDALVKDATEQIQQDVTAGNLTQSQATSILSDLKAHITEMVQNAGPMGGGPGPGGCDGGPPADFGPPADGTTTQSNSTNTL